MWQHPWFSQHRRSHDPSEPWFDVEFQLRDQPSREAPEEKVLEEQKKCEPTDGIQI